METPFKKPLIEPSRTDRAPRIKLATTILPLEKNVIPLGHEDLGIKTEGEKERFSKLSEGAMEVGTNRQRFWNMLVSTVERAGYKPPQDRQTVVLDLACGRCEEGLVLSAFFGGETFDWTNNNVRLIGVDIKEKDIEKAIINYSMPDFSEKVTKYVLPPNYDFIVGDATNLDRYPQIPKRADIVAIRHQQISDNKHIWTKIFQQALLRLNEGGIIITTSFSDVEHEMLIKALRKLNCEIVINESNPYAKPLSHKEISLDRNIAIIRKKKLSPRQ